MFKITILVCALSLVAIQAYPVARSETPEETELLRRGGCGVFGCGDGIRFTASNLFPSSQFVGAGFRHTTLFPELTFSTGSRFSLPGMQPCDGMVGQPCGTAPPQEATPPPQVVMPPPQAVPPSAPPAPQGCAQAPGVQCNGPPQQAPPQQAPPQEAPPQQAPPQEAPPQQALPAPQGCDQSSGQYCGGSPQQVSPQQAPPTEMPPQQAPPQEAPAQPTPPAAGAAPCDQAQGQACGSSGPTSFNFSNNQSKDIKASSYKETTLYYNHKDAKSASKSANSSTQLNYTKN
ncbi:hypothetical protein GGF42_004291 [Coemansia sp. RSA 2424]|nr:hypothetical protein GGF42_004291 [Coemansia sp. RSA 2424]